eukprot:2759694-Amphidinium_carterae.1
MHSEAGEDDESERTYHSLPIGSRVPGSVPCSRSSRCGGEMIKLTCPFCNSWGYSASWRYIHLGIEHG